MKAFGKGFAIGLVTLIGIGFVFRIYELVIIIRSGI